MMQDADTLSRYHDPLVVAHILCANTYHRQDMANRSDAYGLSVFDSLLQKKIHTTPPQIDISYCRGYFACQPIETQTAAITRLPSC